MTTNFLIGPTNEGLRKDTKPFGTPENSFQELTNAYQFRGRITRRQGYTGLGRFNTAAVDLPPVYPGLPVMGLPTRNTFNVNSQKLIGFDTINSYLYSPSTSAWGPLPSQMPVVWSGANYNFFYSVNYAGALWTTNGLKGLNGVTISKIVAGAGISTITTTAPNTFATGQFVTFININPPPGSSDLNGKTFPIIWIDASNFTIPYAITTPYSGGGFAMNSQVQTAGQNGIRYYGTLAYGSSTFNRSWANYNPPIDPNNALAGALLIFPYRGYLVFLNTWEGNEILVQNFGNRARWTQIGTPYYSAPVPSDPSLQTIQETAARDDLFGKGGANDAPTQEVIVSAGFIRDILVVFFEKSTWRLRFVNNTQNPFVWERVNVELGSDCTFSSIVFDKGLMAISRRGIVISDGNDTYRFDEKIPDDIFTLSVENHGLQRVYGIRTFRTKLNYWIFPRPAAPNIIFPNSVLVFNYDTKNWAFFDDTYTCFGYYYPSNSPGGVGDTWNDLDKPWYTYDASTPSDGVTQSGFETVVAGNQQGFVFQLEQTSGGKNDPSLYIQSIAITTATTPTIITSPNHNLAEGTWISLSGVAGITDQFGISLNGRNFKISNPSNDQNTFVLTGFPVIDAGIASGASWSYTTYKNVIPGSVFIYIGADTYSDANLNGNLSKTSSALTVGTINYITGEINITFNPSIAPTEVYFSVVSFDITQDIVVIQTIGVYSGTGLIAKISNIDITSKYFNFFTSDQRARLSKIDFYVDKTAGGQFTCNVFGDSSNDPINDPLPDNLQSNVVLTSTSPYQIGSGPETIYRLYCDAIAQTIQVQMTLTDEQMAVTAVNSANIDIVAMIFSMRKGGRLT